MLPAIFRLLVHTSCTHVVLYLNPVWNRALFEERFAHQQHSILTNTSYLGVTSQNSETLTCYMNINFILAEFKQRSEKIRVPISSGFSRQKIEAWCCSVAQSCPILCNPIDCSMLGFPVLHHLPEFAQTHVHYVGDAIQPSHSLSSPSPPALSLWNWNCSKAEFIQLMGSLTQFFLQEFSYVFFQVWPFIHIIANNRRNQFETMDWQPDNLNTKEPVGTAKILGSSF